MRKKISTLLTIHNKDFLIERVCDGLINNLSEDNEQIIVVFDGCIDNSESLAKNILKRYHKKVDYVYTDDVFETKANNAGLRLVENDYVIIVQDDMVVKERNFDLRMLKPFQNFEDVFAVTSFVAHNNIFNENTRQINYTDVASKNTSQRDIFYAREYGNRGPLMYDYQDVVKLNYLDEYFAPLHYDDMDLSIRAFKELNKVSGLYWIDYESDLSWGTSRQKNHNLHSELMQINAAKILEKHKDILYGDKFKENRILL